MQHATRRIFGPPPRRRPVARSRLRPLDDLRRRFQGFSVLSLALGGIMLVLIALLTVNFVGQVVQAARLESRRAELEAEVARIKAENAVLEGAVAFTESDVYAERIAREQLGYAREGDIVIFPRQAPVLPQPPPDADADPSALTPARVENWWLWWLALFPPPGPD
ncbi:MAG: septum formation initiator family protein [Chloroflexaceae bacterium]